MLLSARERERWQAFRFSQHRDLYLIAHCLKRLVLTRYELCVEPAAWNFTQNEFGKPFLISQQNPSGLCFNLSHSGTMAAICVTHGQRCGVDVEQRRADVDHLDLARRCFHPREYADVERENASTFFRYWVLKEAFMKLLGIGLLLRLDSFYIDRRKGAIVGHPNGVRTQLANWDLPSNHFLAVGVEGAKVEWPPNIAWLPELSAAQS